ncbi:phenylacetic acid degradation protein [Providencia stuartii]|uniref:phenylacetic acid degradation protein n=1 Tax=Providencia stuartii TaxID=588 RepID=UPI0025AA4CEC|nr:phenylacetic acid degradation protein [Providencia stuartii]MDN0018128.1 phenylacetic acid degradation protein [Providencia stuartii]HEM8878560.1 phenylacetic acid degradation protein [Providencia stuartii]
MHIIIAAISALAALVWALHSLQNSGVDLNSFNPFTWARRRKWQKQYGVKPIYNLSTATEAAAVIIVGALKQEGEISREQKQTVINLFIKNFNLETQDAVDLFSSSSHLVHNEINFDQSIPHILKLSITQFTPAMVETFLSLLEKVIMLEGEPTKGQINIIENVRNEFKRMKKKSLGWKN